MNYAMWCIYQVLHFSNTAKTTNEVVGATGSRPSFKLVNFFDVGHLSRRICISGPDSKIFIVSICNHERFYVIDYLFNRYISRESRKQNIRLFWPWAECHGQWWFPPFQHRAKSSATRRPHFRIMSLGEVIGRNEHKVIFLSEMKPSSSLFLVLRTRKISPPSVRRIFDCEHVLFSALSHFSRWRSRLNTDCPAFFQSPVYHLSSLIVSEDNSRRCRPRRDLRQLSSSHLSQTFSHPLFDEGSVLIKHSHSHSLLPIE
jgi:hypothetical protein